ncbi:hypothetical protein ACX0G9_08120 [Flavitalea flava]
MGKTDQGVIVGLITIIVANVIVLGIGYYTKKMITLTAFLNFLTSGSFVIYWIAKQIKVQQHIFETRELVVVFLEFMVVGFSLYVIAASKPIGWIKNIQYVIWGIHLAVLLGGLVFMFTFKMNKLI